jgi:hypothetical protein
MYFERAASRTGTPLGLKIAPENYFRPFRKVLPSMPSARHWGMPVVAS